MLIPLNMSGNKYQAKLVEDINEVEPKFKTRLNLFIGSHPETSIFQSSSILALYRRTAAYRPFLFVITDQYGDICCTVIVLLQEESKRLLKAFTSRAIVWGGPLLAGRVEKDQHEICDFLLKSIHKYLGRKAIFCQFRNLFDLNMYRHVFKNNHYTYHEHLNYFVKTTDHESTRGNISKSKIRQIKKSVNNGARIIEPSSLEKVRNFYLILKNFYHKKVRKPLPDWTFFKEFFLQSQEGRLGKYFLIEYQQEIVGGIMCPITPGKGIYEWYICGRDGEFKGVYPSVLATWAAIDYALKNNLRFFDFMGAGAPDQDYGVREFKSKFGGELVAHGRYLRINRPWLYALGKFGIRLMGKLR